MPLYNVALEFRTEVKNILAKNKEQAIEEAMNVIWNDPLAYINDPQARAEKIKMDKNVITANDSEHNRRVIDQRDKQ